MTAHAEARTPGEWRRHWTVVAAALAGMTMAATNGYSLGVMIGPLEREFGWSRTEITTGPLIISMMGLVLSPFVGIGIDRWGPRRIGLAGAIMYCLALAYLSTATADVRSWWLRWGLLGFAYIFVSSPVWTSAVNSVFSKNRGKALAFTLCGTGLNAAFVPAITNALIERYGWRHAYVGLALMLGAIAIPIVFFLFRGATDRPRARTAPRAPAAALTGYTTRAGLVSPAFLKLAGAALVFGVTGTALTVNAVPVLMSKGLGATAAAGTAGLVGLGSILGRLTCGFLLDTFDAKKIAAASVAAPLIFVALLLGVPGSATAAAVACFALGLSVGTEVDACAYLAARHFGMRSFGTLFSTMAGLLLFGAGVSPLVANIVYDATRSYDLMLLCLVPLCVLAALLFLWLGRYPDFAAPAAGAQHPDSAGQSGRADVVLPMQ